MTANNKQLETSEEIGITLPYVIKIIKELCPEGAIYANRVRNMAVELSDELDSFYPGAFLPNYGCYPFLIVKEYHLEEGCYMSDQVIVKARFDMDSFNEFVDCLSLSDKMKAEIKQEVYSYYGKTTKALGYPYLEVITYLIETFKFLKTHYEYARTITERFDLSYIGYSYPVNLGKVLTLSYLMKRVNKFNRKKGAGSGKYLLVAKTDSEDRVIVMCQKYNKK